MKCKRCGIEIPEDSEYCPNCGSTLRPSEQATPQYVEEGRQLEEITPLGPRNIGSIIGDTFRIYSRNFVKLLAVAAIVQVPLGVLNLALGFALASLFEGVIQGRLIELITAMTVIVIGLPVINVLGYLIMTGAIINSVSQQYLQPKIDIGQAYRFTLRRLPSILGAGILVSLTIGGIIAIAVLAGFFSLPALFILIPLVIIVGVLLAVRWEFILQASSIESCGPRAALSRSWGLVKNNWWRVFGITLVLGLIVWGISALLEFIPVAGTIIGSVISTPILVTGTTLLYYDLRVRKEGYKLDNLSTELNIRIGKDIA